MKSFFQRCLTVLTLSAAAVSAVSAAPYEALPTATAPAIQGQLGDSCWQAATEYRDFHPLNSEKCVQNTRIKLAYDSTWLYVAFDCDNPQQKLLDTPSITEADGSVSQDESVEFSIAPDGGDEFYKFTLSCFGVRSEYRYKKSGACDRAWSIPWRSATQVRPDGWSAEIAIPMEFIASYGDFAKIRFNVGRNERVPFHDAQGVLTHYTIKFSSLGQVLNSFHEAAARVPLAELKPNGVKLPFFGALESMSVTPYFEKGKQTFYGVELGVKKYGQGKLEIQLTDQPESGPRYSSKTITDGGKITIAIPAEIGGRTLKVALADAATGEVFETRELSNPRELKLFSAYSDRNYYTSEKTARVVVDCKLAIPGLAARANGVVAPLSRELRIPLHDLKIGKTVLNVELLRDGKPIGAVPVELLKRVPKPGFEWKVDRVNRILLNPDGAPVFPMGFFPTIGSAREAEEMAEVGGNTYVHWVGGMNAALTNAQKSRTMFVFTPLVSSRQEGVAVNAQNYPVTFKTLSLPGNHAFYRYLPQKRMDTTLKYDLSYGEGKQLNDAQRHAVYMEIFDLLWPQMAKEIRQVSAEPSTFCYFTFDEPMTWMSDTMRECKQRIDAIDGYRPIWVNFSKFIQRTDDVIDGTADIISSDPYYTPGAPTRHNIDFVAHLTHDSVQRGIKFRQPVYSVILAEMWSGMIVSGYRRITPEEQRSQTIISLIYGVRGLFWFSWPLYSPVSAPTLSALFTTLNRLLPALATPELQQKIVYQDEKGVFPSDFILQDPDYNRYPAFHVRAFRYPDGKVVLLGANTRSAPVKIQIDVAHEKNITELFSGKTLSGLAETVEPLGVRAWVLGAVPEPLDIKITAVAGKDAIKLVRSTPYNQVRTGKKNILPNPDFSRQSLPGVPDYYFASSDAQPHCVGNELILNSSQNRNVSFRCVPQHEKPTTYTISVYAKGDTGKEALTFKRGFDGNKFRKDHKLTTEWARYDWTFEVPPRATDRDMIFTIWIFNGTGGRLKMPQLEKGFQATAWEN